MADPTNLTFLYNNLITDGGMISVSSEATTFEKEYLADDNYITCWRSSGVAGGEGFLADAGDGFLADAGDGFLAGSDCSISIDFNTAQSINCISIGNHNLYGELTTLSLKYGTTAACVDGTIDLLSSLTETNFIEFFTSVSKRYWKLEMAGADTITFYQIGVLFLGAYVELTKNCQPNIENYDPEYSIFEKVTPGGQVQSYNLNALTSWKLSWGSNNGTGNHTLLTSLWNNVKKNKHFWLMLDPSDNDTLKFVKLRDFKFPQIYNDHYPGHMVIEARHV